jgi:hypothetical protein
MLHAQQNDITGVFTEETQAVQTRDDLVRAGFPAERIELNMVREQRTADVPATNMGPPQERSRGGLAVGAIVGACVLGLLGTLFSTGWVGVGPLTDGGALDAVIGAAVGIVVGAIVGGLVGWAWLSSTTTFYANELQTGRFVLTVHADGRASEAADILRRHKALVNP